ncbi:MAG TPA: carboxypeptidase-like regulatory domain-containing protein [Thermoanaerobaculia bacterium]|nr:carboxypeptidase-like regulatory domain-containing protein [Thermoanaerobaculia bacterium]
MRVRGGTVVDAGTHRLVLVPGAAVATSIALGDVVYRGRVEQGGRAVDALLSLEPQSGGSRTGAQTTRVEDGRFAVVLDRPGTFRGSLQMAGGKRIPLTAPIVFESTDEEVVIRAGDAAVSGVVENGRGEPAPRARIIARLDGAAPPAEAQTISRDGTFEVAGLPAGRWLVHAAAEGARSETIPVVLAEGASKTGLRLRLIPTTRVTGRVRHAGGAPASGALVIVHDRAAPAAPALLALTNESGEFTFEIRAGHATTANVVVIASDGAASARRAEIRDGTAVVLPSAYGTVRLQRDRGAWEPLALGSHFLVADDGSWISALASARVDGRSLVWPRLAVGRWRYVVAEPHQVPLVKMGDGIALTPRATFVVGETANPDVSIAFGERSEKP